MAHCQGYKGIRETGKLRGSGITRERPLPRKLKYSLNDQLIPINGSILLSLSITPARHQIQRSSRLIFSLSLGSIMRLMGVVSLLVSVTSHKQFMGCLVPTTAVRQVSQFPQIRYFFPRICLSSPSPLCAVSAFTGRVYTS